MSPRERGVPASLFRELVALIGNWWRQDRIRLEPRRADLLSLSPGCIIVIGERRLLITDRRPTTDDGDDEVCYLGSGSAGRWQLSLRLQQGEVWCATFRDRDGSCQLEADDVEILF